MAKRRYIIHYDSTTCLKENHSSKKYSSNYFEENYFEDNTNYFQEACEDQLDSLLIRYGLAQRAMNREPIKHLGLPKKGKTKVRKTLPVTPKLIIFNKSIMAKHPDIELNNARVFTSILDMIFSLKTDEDCRNHLEKIRWNGEPICPKCGSQRPDHYRINTRGQYRGRYKCKDCYLPFSVTIGTIFEQSPIPLNKWFYAIFMFSSHKKGISSKQLARDIQITQKSAWFMLSKIRNSFAVKTDFQFEGIVQMDETYVGGKNLNKIKGKRISKTQGRSLKTKTPVFGMVNEGIVYAEVVKNTKGKTLGTIVRDKVTPGSTVVTDGWPAYRQLSDDYQHMVIPHNRDIFKLGSYHTNSIEGFWSLLKRGIFGIYHSVSPKHLHKYCDEFAFRYNTRHMGEGERFNMALINSDERIMYKELIAEKQ